MNQEIHTLIKWDRLQVLANGHGLWLSYDETDFFVGRGKGSDRQIIGRASVLSAVDTIIRNWIVGQRMKR